MKFKPILLSETVTDVYSKTFGHSLHWFDSHLSGEISNKIWDFQSDVLTLITHCFNALNSIGIIVIGKLFLFKVSALPAVNNSSLCDGFTHRNNYVIKKANATTRTIICVC